MECFESAVPAIFLSYAPTFFIISKYELEYIFHEMQNCTCIGSQQFAKIFTNDTSTCNKLEETILNCFNHSNHFNSYFHTKIIPFHHEQYTFIYTLSFTSTEH